MADDRAEGGTQVMEHREPPRIAVGERRFEAAIQDSGARFPLRTLDPVRKGRQRELGRTGLLALAASAFLAAFIYLGIHAIWAAVAWLHHQSDYQLPFNQIQLVNEPPTWYRGGAQQFLAQVRQSAAETERISLLEQGPEGLAVAFRKYSWVLDVAKVTYQPGRILVDLRYRQPVAWVDLPRGQHQIVDGKGILLRSEDIDVERLGPVIKITGDGLLAPSDLRPGVIWKRKGKAGAMDEADGRILAASKLADFLRQEDRASDSTAARALRIPEIIVSDFQARGLFVMNAEGAEIWWEAAPGDERADEPSALEKWRMLLQWQQTTRARLLDEGDFWAFSRKGLYTVCPPSHNPSHQPRAASEQTGGQPDSSKQPAGSG
jgi:hypothetical protein